MNFPSRLALRHVLRCAAFALVGLGLAAGVGAAELAIATAPSTLSLPLFVADAEGLFAAEGLQVRLVECRSGACLDRVLDGSAQFGTASELPVVLKAFERGDFAIVATLVTALGDAKVVARRSAGIAEAASLPGKRVALVAGSSSHYFFDSLMLFHDIDPKAVTQVRLPIEQLVPALRRREVDAIVGYSVHAWQAMKELGSDGIVLPDPRIYTQTYNLVATRSILASRPADVAKVLRALVRAQRFIAEQPARARELLEARLKLDRAFVEASFPIYTFRLSLDPSLAATMAGEARWAQREGHVPAGARFPDQLQLLDAGPLRSVVPSLFLQ